MKRCRGFTLIEILIVMAIISIVSGVAVLAITSNQNKSIEYFTQQLTHLIQLSEEEAMLRPATLGLAFTPTTFQFFSYHKNWQPLTDKNFGEHTIPNNIKIIVTVQNKPVPLDGKPHLIISTSGDVSPFLILIGKQNKPPRHQISGESNGNIKMEEAHENKE